MCARMHDDESWRHVHAARAAWHACGEARYADVGHSERREGKVRCCGGESGENRRMHDKHSWRIARGKGGLACMREAEKVRHAAAGGGEGGEESVVTCRASRSSSAAASGVIVPSGPRAACAPASMPRSLRRPCTCVIEGRWEVTDRTASRRFPLACAGWPLARDAVHRRSTVSSGASGFHGRPTALHRPGERPTSAPARRRACRAIL